MASGLFSETVGLMRVLAWPFEGAGMVVRGLRKLLACPWEGGGSC